MTGAATAVARRQRVRREGPQLLAITRPQLIPYVRIAESFINAVELELPPCATTAVAMQTDRLWMERKLWAVREAGWLPKGPSPLPGEDRTAWLAAARALVATRQAEVVRLQEDYAMRRHLARSRATVRRRAKRSMARAMRPSTVALDRFGLL